MDGRGAVLLGFLTLFTEHYAAAFIIIARPALVPSLVPSPSRLPGQSTGTGRTPNAQVELPLRSYVDDRVLCGVQCHIASRLTCRTFCTSGPSWPLKARALCRDPFWRARRTPPARMAPSCRPQGPPPALLDNPGKAASESQTPTRIISPPPPNANQHPAPSSLKLS
jgi:hypothetical protein